MDVSGHTREHIYRPLFPYERSFPIRATQYECVQLSCDVRRTLGTATSQYVNRREKRGTLVHRGYRVRLGVKGDLPL